MKKYVKPTMNGQIFAGDEYVAVCGSQTSYKFKCNAGKAENWWDDDEWGYLYLNDWTPSTCYKKTDQGYVATDHDYLPCGETHESDTNDLYVLGWFDTDSKPGNGKNHTQVYIWQEIEDGYVVNHHATTDIQDIVSQINRS